VTTLLTTAKPPDLETFRAEALAFLEAHAKPKHRDLRGFVWGEGSDAVALFEEADPGADATALAASRAWRQAVYDAGFGWISGPVEYGGRALSKEHQRVWHELERRFATPSPTPFNIGLGMVSPTILAHGTEITKQRYLRALHRADRIGCQLFSEPGAGSDLASVATRAEPNGHEWIVNGQKVWTSGAHYSDIGLLLARSAPEPRYGNLTAFVVDLHAPGVEVRPLRQMTGGAAFNEVFLTDVRIPDDHRLGGVGDGWRVALTTLMNERAAVGRAGSGGAGILSAARLVAMARHLGIARGSGGDPMNEGDPVARQEFTDVYIRLAVARYTRLRADARHRAGQPPGPEMSMGKVALTDNLAAVSRLVTRWLGPQLTADAGQWGTYAWADFVLGVPGLRLGGGTDEIQRNIVAERVLGLPKEPGRLDTPASPR
jgi:alkylation response protein AidB-like acyl-CoA dehydrogenase